MAGLAALFASPALPFPSTSSSSTSCSCRFRPAVACAPRHQPAPRRVTRRFDEVEGASKKRRGVIGGGGSLASSTRKDKGLAVDFKESQVADFEDLEEDKFLNAVVKVYCTHIRPDYGLPWQKQRQHSSTGSAFMIGDGKLLTNAHCVEHDTQIKVKRRGDDKKYVAKVLARGTECDLALLSVENEEFWRGTEPLQLGRLPCLQDSVTVVGYPLGGDTISVTKGVVSRIEVTPYAHGTSDLLGVQIDAAINAGNSGGPAFNEQGECIGVAFQVLQKALEVWDLLVVPLDSPAAGSSLFDPELEIAFICHLQDHWFCIRKVNEEWYNFNSLYPAPEHLSKFYLSAYIDTLKGSGWSIFAVRGNFPKECPMATEGSNGFGQWLLPDDARRITASCNQVQTPPRQQVVSPLRNPSEGMSEMELIAAEQEEADLNAAIAASLMDTGGQFGSHSAPQEESRPQVVLPSEAASDVVSKDSNLEEQGANKAEASEPGNDGTEESAPVSYPRERSPPSERRQ